MRFLDKLESKLGRFAIPGLVQALAALQLVVVVLLALLPGESREAFQQFLLLNPEKIVHGEVWRLFTYVFIPRASLLWAVIGAFFFMWIGRGLDEAWGAFRVNLYVFGGMVFFGLGSLIFGYGSDQLLFYLSILLAFACIFPNEEMRLYGILPLKMKWFALLSAGTAVVNILRFPGYAIPVCFALLNFFIAFGPDFLRGRLHAAKVAQRRDRFEGASLHSADAFHKCSVCGKTEQDDKTLDFRVTDSGEEICSECRKMRVVT